MDNQSQTTENLNSTSEKKSKLKIVVVTLLLSAGILAASFAAYQLSQDEEVETNNNTSTTSLVENDIPSLTEPISLSEVPTKLFVSEQGKFSIELPENVIMTEIPEKSYTEGDSEYTSGATVFTFNELDEESEPGTSTQPRFTMSYGKPSILGKGGVCRDKNSEPAPFSIEVIAGQEVSVCKVDGQFYAGYFVHPTQEIEYSFAANYLNADEIEVFYNAVVESLEFN